MRMRQGARGHLLTGYKAVIEPAMQSRWRDVERRRGRRNSHDLSFGDLGRDEKVIRDYIKNQEKEDQRLDQLNLWR